MDSEERAICSRCRSSSDMMASASVWRVEGAQVLSPGNGTTSGGRDLPATNRDLVPDNAAAVNARKCRPPQRPKRDAGYRKTSRALPLVLGPALPLCHSTCTVRYHRAPGGSLHLNRCCMRLSPSHSPLGNAAHGDPFRRRPSASRLTDLFCFPPPASPIPRYNWTKAGLQPALTAARSNHGPRPEIFLLVRSHLGCQRIRALL